MKDIPNIGNNPEASAKRDAIHVAVAPVKALERLGPGWHVGMDANGNASSHEKPIGVVDPFRKDAVGSGEAFWLFLYPGTITSLRHEWSHPAFVETTPVDGNAIVTKEVSEKWLRDIADQCGVSYEHMIRCVDEDDFISMGQNEHYKDVIDDRMDEFNLHCSVVLGRDIKNAYPFSCSC